MNGSTNKTLMKFWAPWCRPCLAMKPVIEEVLGDFNDIEFVDINVDEDPDMAREYSIRTIPALVLKEGDRVEKLIGSVSTKQVKDFLSKRA